MHKISLIIIIFFVITLTTVEAVEFEIKKNGEGSSNSINVEEKSGSTIHQGGSVQINNTVNANASTGDNNVSGNTNGNSTIKTGDANVNVDINNNGNSNSINPKTSPTGTPTSIPTKNVEQTPSSNNQPSSNSSSPSSSNEKTGGIGGGDVKGLAATSGIDSLSFLSSVAGFICLFIGSALVSKRHP